MLRFDTYYCRSCSLFTLVEVTGKGKRLCPQCQKQMEKGVIPANVTVLFVDKFIVTKSDKDGYPLPSRFEV